MRMFFTAFFCDLSQTFFIGKSRNGLALFAIVLLFNPRGALAGLVTGVVARLYGMSLQPNKLLVQSGLFGMNGFFLGLGFVSLFATGWYLPLFLVLGGMLTALATLFFHRVFLNWQFPLLVFPYAFILSLFWGMKGGVPVLTVAPPAAAATLSTPLWHQFTVSTLNSFSEIFFLSHPGLGAAVVLFLFVTQPRLALYGIGGALLANLTAFVLQLSVPLMLAGYWGFSGALVSIALGVGYRGIRWSQVILAVVSVVGLMAGMGAVVAPLGLSPLSFPYILVVWVFLTVAPMQSKREAVRMESSWDPKRAWMPAVLKLGE